MSREELLEIGIYILEYYTSLSQKLLTCSSRVEKNHIAKKLISLKKVLIVIDYYLEVELNDNKRII